MCVLYVRICTHTYCSTEFCYVWCIQICGILYVHNYVYVVCMYVIWHINMYACIIFVHTKPYDLTLSHTRDLVNVFKVLEQYIPKCMFQTFAYVRTNTVVLNFILFKIEELLLACTQTLQIKPMPFTCRLSLTHTLKHWLSLSHTHKHSLSHTHIQIRTHTRTHTPHGDDRWRRTKNTARASRIYRWASRSHSPNTVSISKPWRRTRTSWIALTSSNAALSSRSLCIFTRLFVYD